MSDKALYMLPARACYSWQLKVCKLCNFWKVSKLLNQNSKATEVKEKRSRQWMYTQQVRHLKISIDEIKKRLSTSGAEEFAEILHDKDPEVEPNVHVVMKFKNAKTASAISKLFEDEPQYFEAWKGRINNAYSYLLHLTGDSEVDGKHVYDVSEVYASFNFKAKMELITKDVGKKEVTEKIKEYAYNLVTLDELKKEIGLYYYALRKSEIDAVTKVKLEAEHKQWVEEYSSEHGVCHVFWYYGSEGTYKSTVAKYQALAIARSKGYEDSIFFTGASNDYFAGYKGEKIIVWNDLRPNEIKWSDLLTMLDPHHHDKQAPARYHNAWLNIEYLFITTPLSPQDYYDNQYVSNRSLDNIGQLTRRLYKIVNFDSWQESWSLKDRFLPADLKDKFYMEMVNDVTMWNDFKNFPEKLKEKMRYYETLASQGSNANKTHFDVESDDDSLPF